MNHRIHRNQNDIIHASIRMPPGIDCALDGQETGARVVERETPSAIEGEVIHPILTAEREAELGMRADSYRDAA